MLVSLPQIEVVKAQGTIYIRTDGSVEGSDKIQREGNIYTFTDDIFDEIVVEKSNITVDGNGYTLHGSGIGYGFSLYDIDNVTIQNISIQNFTNGIHLQISFNNTISGNTIKNNFFYGIDLTYSYDNIISGNNITNNGLGILFSGGSHNVISGKLLGHLHWR